MAGHARSGPLFHRVRLTATLEPSRQPSRPFRRAIELIQTTFKAGVAEDFQVETNGVHGVAEAVELREQAARQIGVAVRVRGAKANVADKRLDAELKRANVGVDAGHQRSLIIGEFGEHAVNVVVIARRGAER